MFLLSRFGIKAMTRAVYTDASQRLRLNLHPAHQDYLGHCLKWLSALRVHTDNYGSTGVNLDQNISLPCLNLVNDSFEPLRSAVAV